MTHGCNSERRLEKNIQNSSCNFGYTRCRSGLPPFLSLSHISKTTRSRVGAKMKDDLPKQIQRILENMGNPTFVWRESLVDELYPHVDSHRYGKKNNGCVSGEARSIRRKITMYMSDPASCGYMYDGGNSHNPRFRKVD